MGLTFIFIIVRGKNTKNVVDIFARGANILAGWFQNNELISKKEKSRLIVFGDHTATISIKIDNTVIELSRKQNLLGIILDGKLNFMAHITILCKKR